MKSSLSSAFNICIAFSLWTEKTGVKLLYYEREIKLDLSGSIFGKITNLSLLFASTISSIYRYQIRYRPLLRSGSSQFLPWLVGSPDWSGQDYADHHD